MKGIQLPAARRAVVVHDLIAVAARLSIGQQKGGKTNG